MDDTLKSQGHAQAPPAENSGAESRFSQEELRTQLVELRQDLIERDHALTLARNQVERREANLRAHANEIAGLKLHIASLKAYIELLKLQVEHWKTVLRAIEQSTSWRLTSRVRFAAKSLRDVSQLTRLFFHSPEAKIEEAQAGNLEFSAMNNGTSPLGRASDEDQAVAAAAEKCET